MPPKYDFAAVERRWQRLWKAAPLLQQPERLHVPANVYDRSWKFVVMTPAVQPIRGSLCSWTKLNSLILADAVARFNRMQGKHVLFPIAWNCRSKEAIQQTKELLERFGLTVDWEREVDLHSSTFKDRTKLLFLHLLHSNRIYRKRAQVMYDPVHKAALMSAQIDDSGNSTFSRMKADKETGDFWFLRTSHISKSLVKDMNMLHKWPESALHCQRVIFDSVPSYIVHFRISRSHQGVVSVYIPDLSLLDHVNFVILVRANSHFESIDYLIHPLNQSKVTIVRVGRNFESYGAEAIVPDPRSKSYHDLIVASVGEKSIQFQKNALAMSKEIRDSRKKENLKKLLSKKKVTVNYNMDDFPVSDSHTTSSFTLNYCPICMNFYNESSHCKFCHVRLETRDVGISQFFSCWWPFRSFSVLADKYWTDEGISRWGPINLLIASQPEVAFFATQLRIMNKVCFATGHLSPFQEPIENIMVVESETSAFNLSFLDEYGADVLRFSLITSSNSPTDFRKTEIMLASLKKAVDSLKRIYAIVGKFSRPDAPLEDSVSGFARELIETLFLFSDSITRKLSATNSEGSVMVSLEPLVKILVGYPDPSENLYLQSLRCLILTLAPLTPHFSAECWSILCTLGNQNVTSWSGDPEKTSVHQQTWPKCLPDLSQAKPKF